MGLDFYWYSSQRFAKIVWHAQDLNYSYIIHYISGEKASVVVSEQ